MSFAARRRATGLGIAGREYVKALKSPGVRVVIGERGRQKALEQPLPKVLVCHYAPHTLRISKERRHADALRGWRVRLAGKGRAAA